jgi:hypothetical protein
MVEEKPPPAPPPNVPPERKRPPDNSLIEPVILSPVSSTTENKNRRLIRFEFTTKKEKASRKNTNDEPLQTLIKKMLILVCNAVPTFEIHPIEDWPKNYTTVSSTVKTAPESEKHHTNHTEENTEKTKTKTPIITTPDALPTDRIGLDKYFQYTSEEHHPGEAKKIVVRLYSTTSKTVSEIRQAVTTEVLRNENMWLSESRFDTLRETSIGWVHKVHPDATNRDHFAFQLHEFLTVVVQKEAADADNADDFTLVTQTNKRPKPSSELSAVTPVQPTPTCPPFSVLSKRTGINLPTTDGTKGAYIFTDVLQIRCATVDSMQLQDIIAAACDNDRFQNQFIPYSLRATNPSLYTTAIQTQQAYISTSTVIRVDGFSTGGLDLPYQDDSEETFRKKIEDCKLFDRIDETITASRSKGRVLFLTDFARRAAAEAFLDVTLPQYFENKLRWDQKEILLLPGVAFPTMASNSQTQSDPVSLYTANLVNKLPPLSSVEFDSSNKAHSSSHTNAWKKKRNTIFFLDKPKTSPNNTRSSPNKATLTSDTSETGESTNTAPTLATQLSQTEALIDSKLAAFRTEIESSMESRLSKTIEQLVAPLAMQFEKLSNQIEQILMQNTQNQTPQYSTAALLHHHRNDDNISVHTQSPGRPFPPEHHHPIIYPPPQPRPPDPHHDHALPHQTLIFNESNPDPEFAAQHHSPYQQTNHVDQSMADHNLTMADLDQSVINRTMTDQQITAQEDATLDSHSPPIAPKGILRNTSDKAPSGGASK